ncbi:MAG: hypothetical protein KGI28_00525 [Thaumarchaeota archaeon]|nr:hypothetical protein [Nitrososphaerota archaeon]
MTRENRYPELITTDVKTWKDIIIATYYNIKSILDSARVLLDVNIEENRDVLFERPFVCAGLYTFAVEEYGKVVYLLMAYSSTGRITIHYKREFRSHSLKFKLALDFIPKECKVIHKGGFGEGFGKGFDIDETADMESRMAIFYSDFDEQNNVKKLPIVDVNSLEIAITNFTRFIEDDLERFIIQNPIN